MHWMCTLSIWVNWDQELETIIWNIFLCRSDPTENDSVEGLRPNARGPGLVTFGVSKILILLEHLQRVLLMAHLLGPSSAPTHFAAIDFWQSFCVLQPDRVMEFCKNNDLQLIVRAHECVMDGFERFAQGHLITLFSATNYCGKSLFFPPNHIVFRLLSLGTFRKRSRQRRGRNWNKIGIFFFFGGFFCKCRDSQQCRSNSGSWTGPGSGAQAYPPYPTCHSFPWVITRTPPWRDVDAGENICIIYLAFTWVTSALNFTFRT